MTSHTMKYERMSSWWVQKHSYQQASQGQLVQNCKGTVNDPLSTPPKATSAAPKAADICRRCDREELEEEGADTTPSLSFEKRYASTFVFASGGAQRAPKDLERGSFVQVNFSNIRELCSVCTLQCEVCTASPSSIPP